MVRTGMTMKDKKDRRTVKFSISMPASDFKEIERACRKSGRSRSQFLREAVLGAPGRRPGEAGPGDVREERAAYAILDPAAMTDAAESRRRAIAAAGAFSSGVGDLSAGHDKYIADAGPDRDQRPPGRNDRGKGRG